MAWDIAGWHERRHATGERQFFRGAERPDDVDYGLVKLRIVNDTERDWVVDQVSVDDWGGSRFDGPVQPDEILSRRGTDAATRVERRNVDHLLASGFIRLTDMQTGEHRTIVFAVDRRRPTSCTLGIRVIQEGATISGCEPLFEHRTSDLWLLGRPDY